MKIALCFLISYEQILIKEEVWREWVEKNKDRFNVYFHYRDFSQIKSEWIRNHTIPFNFVVPTSYLHVVPAYFSLMTFALHHDKENQWFCFLTDSCVPIVASDTFCKKFEENRDKSIIRCKPAWWNPAFHKRANLHRFQKEFHLGNDPWFILKREDVEKCLLYKKVNPKQYNLICKGIIANESIFAIILKTFNQMDEIVNESTHITDWENMSSSTSPYIFKSGSQAEIDYIQNAKEKNKFFFFLRKIGSEFPDSILGKFT